MRLLRPLLLGVRPKVAFLGAFASSTAPSDESPVTEPIGSDFV